MKNIILEKNFFKQADALRGHFVKNFENPRETHQQRFVWDFWHVPDQYTLLRTPAYHYFPQKVYQNFHSQLVQWGRENLGCHDISPPWLSVYIDGCKQELHSDVPHGPWAFVYSLTDWKNRKFSGGETLMLKPEVLSYWQNFSDSKDREQNSFLDRIPADFNKLTVFDPRYPHGVTEVRGTRNPLEGRIVIHGWFVEPRPYVVGALSTKEVDGILKDSLFHIEKNLQDYGSIHGTISVRLQVGAAGAVTGFKVLTNTLVSTTANSNEVRLILKDLQKILMYSRYPKKSKGSQITIPLLFK